MISLLHGVQRIARCKDDETDSRVVISVGLSFAARHSTTPFPGIFTYPSDSQRTVGNRPSSSACNVTASIICAINILPILVIHRRYCQSWFSLMVQRNYIPWPPAEERNLPPWLERHRHLTWEQRAAKYCSEVNNGRTSESLRSKAAQLRKQIRRRRAVHRKRPQPSSSTARSARRRQGDMVNNLSMMQIPVPPVWGLTPRRLNPQAAFFISEHECNQLQTTPSPHGRQNSGVQGIAFAAAPLRNQPRQANFTNRRDPHRDPTIQDRDTRDGAEQREDLRAPSHPQCSVPKTRLAGSQTKTPFEASLWHLFHRFTGGSRTPKQAGSGKGSRPTWSRTSPAIPPQHLV